MIDKELPLFVSIFERTLNKILECVCVSAENDLPNDGLGFPSICNTAFQLRRTFTLSTPPAVSAMAVAYSGGLDSSVLLHLARRYADIHHIKLFAFHVHHGINVNADTWLKHCQDECKRLNISFDARYVDIAKHEKNGIEAAARICRYAALGELCRHHQVPVLLTAHHQDDQAETLLLQLLRGCGVAGLSGMDSANVAPALLGSDNITMARPLLTVSRQELAHFVADNEIAFVEDSSNTDPRYARNALRHNIMLSLAEHFPGFQERFTRTAQHAQSAQRLLAELASQDLAICQEDNSDSVKVERLRQLSIDRVDNLLRFWFGARGLSMPSTAWLGELRTQLLEAKNDAQICVTHQSCHIRRHKGRIFITPKFAVDASLIMPMEFRWNGERQLHFPVYGGILYFDEVANGSGIDAEWLSQQSLWIRYRQGGERLKLTWNRPTKSLKYHYQSLDIPAWERGRLPLVTANDQLLFAAGIGMDCHHLSNESKTSLHLRWVHTSSSSPE